MFRRRWLTFLLIIVMILISSVITQAQVESNNQLPTTVSTTTGRVVVTVDDVGAESWVRIWIGKAGSFQTVPQYNRPGASAGWYEKATEMDCGSGSCDILTVAYPVNGNYVFYHQAWNGSAITDWQGPFEFTLNNGTPNAPGSLNAEVNDSNQATLSWGGANGAIWYNVWMGPGATSYYQWSSADDLGCLGGGTCTLNIPAILNPGLKYTWYVQAWGPGGFSTGGTVDGWSKGPDVEIAASAGKPFLMQNGLVVVEYESAPPAGDWVVGSALGGASGQYYHWSGPDYFGSPGNGTMSYGIYFPEAGLYRFQFRTATGPTDDGSEENDAWVRILGEGSKAVAIKGTNTSQVNMNNDWFKVYQNQGEQKWVWIASHVDNNAHNVFFEISTPGTYVVEVSGRSAEFNIDRFVVYDPEQVTESFATSLDRPQSPRVP